MTLFVRTPLTGHDCRGVFQRREEANAAQAGRQTETDRDSRTLVRARTDGGRGCHGAALQAKLSRSADITRCRPTAVDTEIPLRASLIKEVKTRRPRRARTVLGSRPERASESNIYLTTADEREDFATPPPYFIFSPLSLSLSLPLSFVPSRIFALLPIVSVCQRLPLSVKKCL